MRFTSTKIPLDNQIFPKYQTNIDIRNFSHVFSRVSKDTMGPISDAQVL